MNAPANLPTLSRTTAVRQDGWTLDRRRQFLECVAEGQSIESACARVGISKVAAYALRRRDPGFALGWSGAVLRARDALADILTSRVLDGQVETWTRADGVEFSRRRYDNRLAMALLNRLDRLAVHPPTYEIGDPDAAAARSVASDFDAYLDLIETGEIGESGKKAGEGDEGEIAAAPAVVDAAAIGAFVDTRLRKLRKLSGGQRAYEIDNGGRQAPPKEKEIAPEEDAVWYDNVHQELRTNLPAPRDFDGVEHGKPGFCGYWRTLTGEEQGVARAHEAAWRARQSEAAERRRAAWFSPDVARTLRGG